MRPSGAITTLKDAAQPILHQVSNSTRDIVIVISASLVVAAIVFCWAAFLRKRPRRGSSWHTSHGSSHGHGEHRHHRRHRRRHHERLPRNPTLAETGGLPERRSDDSSGTAPNPDLS